MALKVLFLGNHTVGIKVLDTLIREKDIELVGIIAHPKDPEDGIRYQSVFDYAKLKNIKVIRSNLNKEEDINFIKLLQPDLLFVTDFKFLLKKDVLKIPKIGSVNLHPSLLPKYRGRASINWAIINGEKELGLTGHWINEGTDSGDIIKQLKFKLDFSENINDALQKYYPLYKEITKEIINIIKSGDFLGQKQIEKDSSYFPKRIPNDGLINWNYNNIKIYNFVRAISYPYPGAFSYLNKEKIIIWETNILSDTAFEKTIPNGYIIDYLKNKIYVKCFNSAILISRFEPSNIPIKIGDVFKSI